MLAKDELRRYSRDVDNLAIIANGYISEGAKYEEIINGYWFDQEVQSIIDRYPGSNDTKENLKDFIAEKIKLIANGQMVLYI